MVTLQRTRAARGAYALRGGTALASACPDRPPVHMMPGRQLPDGWALCPLVPPDLLETALPANVPLPDLGPDDADAKIRFKGGAKIRDENQANRGHFR